jgi:hypothetical protein
MQRSFTLLRKILFTIIVTAGAAAVIGFGRTQDPQEGITAPIPVIRSHSSIGDVAFPHQFHFEDLEFECQTCHHETNASALRMPHKDYFDDFWIDCRICHRSDGSTVSRPQSCSNCHHDSPTDIADETLSAKVVIHKKCWECHELEKGEEASRGCSECHLKKSDSSVNPQSSGLFSMKGQGI